MSEKDDHITEPELDNQGEGGEPEPVKEPATTPSEEPKSDPLDEMDDSQLRAFGLGIGRTPDQSLSGDDLRADIKKHRSIHQRKAATQDHSDGQDDVVRKSDLESSKEKEAKESLIDSSDPTLADIHENWTKYAEFYTPRNGRDTVQSIVKDMRIARAAYREANPSTDNGKDATRQAAEIRGAGGRAPSSTPERKTIIPKRQSIQEWYKKSE